MAIRLLWVFPFTLPAPAAETPAQRGRRRRPGGTCCIVGWTGMRGAVSLAAALALPLVIDGGGGLPRSAI